MTLELSLGALAEPLSKQLQSAGLHFPGEYCKHWQKDLDAINRLQIRRFISDSTAHKCRQKLMKLIAKEVKE